MERASQVIGQSGAFLDALERASRAAALDRPVLVIGERGTGKELVAERLHRLSPRWDHPLVVMNCAALPETLIEAELFGHEAGAFTGATKARTGRFEEADGGTLFLDELGTLSMAAQDRLLRAVEYGEITRIGSSRPMRVDVRIVAATNEHLPDKVEAHEFRADLLDRLSFEVVTLPPLRSAGQATSIVLAEHFGRRMAAELGWRALAGVRQGGGGNDSVVAPSLAGQRARAAQCRRAGGVPVGRGRAGRPDRHRSVRITVIGRKASRGPVRRLSQTGTGDLSRRFAPAFAVDCTMTTSSTACEIRAVRFQVAALPGSSASCSPSALAEHRFNQRQRRRRAGPQSYDQLRHALKPARPDQGRRLSSNGLPRARRATKWRGLARSHQCTTHSQPPKGSKRWLSNCRRLPYDYNALEPVIDEGDDDAFTMTSIMPPIPLS